MAKDKYKDKYIITNKMKIDDYEYGFINSYPYNTPREEDIQSRYYLLADGWKIVTNFGKYGYDHIVRRSLKKKTKKKKEKDINRFELMDI